MIPPEGTTILAASGLKAPGSADAKDAMSGLLRQGGWTPLRLDDALFRDYRTGLEIKLAPIALPRLTTHRSAFARGRTHGCRAGNSAHCTWAFTRSG